MTPAGPEGGVALPLLALVALAPGPASGWQALEVSQRTDVAQNRTIPAGTALSFANGGAFVVAAGVTLTINGSLTAPAQHIFDGPGRVRFAPDSPVDRVLPQWFGAKPGGSADCTLAVQRAIESVQAVTDDACATPAPPTPAPSR